MLAYKKIAMVSLSAMMALALLAGCQKSTSDGTSEGASPNTKAEKQTEQPSKPVTLSFYSMPSFDKEKIQTRIVDPVKKKFPKFRIGG